MTYLPTNSTSHPKCEYSLLVTTWEQNKINQYLCRAAVLSLLCSSHPLWFSKYVLEPKSKIVIAVQFLKHVLLYNYKIKMDISIHITSPIQVQWSPHNPQVLSFIVIALQVIIHQLIWYKNLQMKCTLLCSSCFVLNSSELAIIYTAHILNKYWNTEFSCILMQHK